MNGNSRIFQMLDRLGVKYRMIPLEQLRKEAGNESSSGFYRWPEDDITLAESGTDLAFVAPHELIHWTGSRLHRGTWAKSGAWPAAYVAEEVVAQAGGEIIARDLLYADIHEASEAYILNYADNSGMPKHIEERARQKGREAAEWIKQRLRK